MGIRKNYRNLTDVERDRFVQGLNHVKSSGLVDQFAEIHRRHFFMNIHRSSHFLPWHREMLLRFERELQRFHPDITIPYWDSTVDRSPSDPLWSNNFLGQFNSAWNLRRALGSGPLSTQQDVETNQTRDNYDAFWRELENPIHNRPHVWVEGVMGGAASPGDPVFYLHHCWIDMLWARWQLANPGEPFVSSGAGAGLNDPLMEWPDRTPANVLDHHALGYSYDIEKPSTASFQSHNFPDRFIRHQNFLGELTPIVSDLDRQDSTFEIVPGLADPRDERLISFRSINFPNHFLRHQDFRLKLHERPSDPSQQELFNADTTFTQRPGLADVTATSFVSFNFPDRFIRHRAFHLFLEPRGTPLIEEDATFRVVAPQSG